MSDEQQRDSEPACEFCECGCCFLHSDCSLDYCACLLYTCGSGPMEESE